MRWACLLFAMLTACSGGAEPSDGAADARPAPDAFPVPPRCGDGVLQQEDGEQCDVGRPEVRSGCSVACQIEQGWICDGASPSVCEGLCGDGAIVGDEECDNENVISNDGCTDTCETELGWTCSGEPSICETSAVCDSPIVVAAAEGGPLESCKAYLDAGFLGNGLYTVDPDGANTGLEPFNVLCDMVTDGGGWTIITNNNKDDAEPTACLPRIANATAQVCGSPTCGADFAVRADKFRFRQVLWVAYQVDFAPTAYQLLGFNSPTVFPSTPEWVLEADTFNTVMAELAANPRITCDSVSPSRLRSIGNVQISGDGTFPANTIVTVFGGQTNVNDKRMSFTDNGGGAGRQNHGLDDFQGDNGRGCGDNWSPKSQRGASSFVMIR